MGTHWKPEDDEKLLSIVESAAKVIDGFYAAADHFGREAMACQNRYYRVKRKRGYKPIASGYKRCACCGGKGWVKE